MPSTPPRTATRSPGSKESSSRCPLAGRSFVYASTSRKEDEIHHGDTPAPGTPKWDRLSADEPQAVYADYQAINQTQGVTPGLWLESPETATTVRVESGQPLATDGPFVAVEEALGGYLFYDADDLDAAIALAGRIPAARLGGAVEVRPVKQG